MTAITLQQLEDAAEDAEVLNKIVNGAADLANPGEEDGTVTTRSGAVVKTAARVIADQAVQEQIATEQAEAASASATLAGLYANADDDADIEGAPAGDRGAKYHADRAAAQAAAGAAAVNTGNVNIIGEPGEIVVNDDGYVLRRTVVDQAIDTQSAALDQATKLAQGIAYVGALKARYPAADLPDILTDEQWQANGQSLSVGSDSIPWYVDSVPYAFMPNGGQRYAAAGTDPAVDFASIVPMVSSIAEVGLGAAVRMFAQLMRDENGVDLAAMDKRIVAASIGEGSRSISELYAAPLVNRIAADWNQGQLASAPRRITPAVMFWLQGEKDYQIDTSQAAYETALDNFQIKTQADARTATDNAGLILPMITYQCASHISYGRTIPKVALAQLRRAQANPLIAMGPPAYFFPYGSITAVHPFSRGYVWMMADFGMRYKRWRVDKVKPTPLAAVSTTRAGRSMFIKFDVKPGRRLVLDTVTLPNQGNFGFTAIDNLGAPLAISAVSIVGNGDVIRLDFAADVVGGSGWRYGWTTVAGVQGRGNLRDNSTIIFDPDDAALPMWDWAAIDEGTAA